MIAVVSLIASSAIALAAALPDGGATVQDVARAMQAKGYQTEITTDKYGDPLINSMNKGMKFSVWFYECNKGTQRCKSFQFAAGFTVDPKMALSKVNEWNRTQRFGRLYLNQQSNPWVETDVDVEYGATTEALVNDVVRWILVMDTFRKYINQ